jgi:Ni/Co efflux regulator RcnB
MSPPSSGLENKPRKKSTHYFTLDGYDFNRGVRVFCVKSTNITYCKLILCDVLSKQPVNCSKNLKRVRNVIKLGSAEREFCVIDSTVGAGKCIWKRSLRYWLDWSEPADVAEREIMLLTRLFRAGRCSWKRGYVIDSTDRSRQLYLKERLCYWLDWSEPADVAEREVMLLTRLIGAGRCSWKRGYVIDSTDRSRQL